MKDSDEFSGLPCNAGNPASDASDGGDAGTADMIVRATDGGCVLNASLELVPDQMPGVMQWERDLLPIVQAGPRGRGERIAALAERRDVPAKTVRKMFDRYVAHGLLGLIDRRHCSKLWNAKAGEAGLSDADRELVKTWVEKYQRKNRPAVKAMRKAWISQRINDEQRKRGLSVPETRTPIDPETGYPIGWSLTNLLRKENMPTSFELSAVRQGRAAAASHRALVYTTRRHLYVGQQRMWDDKWLDVETVDLSTGQRGRALEFHGIDVKSAFKFKWGNRQRVKRDDGTHQELCERDFRFLLAATYATIGYHPEGTLEIIENAKTNIPEWLETLLGKATNGALKFQRGGMSGLPAHVGQYEGRGKGNFRLKASLESLGGAEHNELAYLRGQSGKDRMHAPEEQHGRQRHTDMLLSVLSQLPPERIEWLSWDYCTTIELRLILEEVYGRMALRSDHSLEGWDELWVPDPRSSNGMRRKSPLEVYRPGCKAFVTLPPEVIALFFSGDKVFLEEHGRELTTSGRMLTTTDGSVSGDKMRFDASALPDREKFLTVLNPFAPDSLWVYDAKAAFVAALPRYEKVDRGDIEAVMDQVARAKREEGQALIGPRRRALQEGRERAAAMRNNARVIGGNTPADRERRKSLSGLNSGDLLATSATAPADASPADAVTEAAQAVCMEDFLPKNDSALPDANEEAFPEESAEETQTLDPSALL